jgi:acetyl esterase/lipase
VITDQCVDVRAGGGPLVIFFHGGFWRHEYDRGHTGPLAAALAAEGLTVATPEYRRTGAPGGGWPGTFDDVVAALRTLPALLSARLGPVGPAVLAGHSAGGHLALWAASRSSRVPAVVGLAPVADLIRAYELDLDGGASGTARWWSAGGARTPRRRRPDSRWGRR